MISYKVTVDPKIKLVKNVWSGKPDPEKNEEALKTIEEGCNASVNEVQKFNRGETLCLIDLSTVDLRFLPPGSEKIVYESTMSLLSYVKKEAQIVSSLVLEKSLGKVMYGDNFKMFDSEQAAMKWLME